jgi:HNH endonuclease
MRARFQPNRFTVREGIAFLELCNVKGDVIALARIDVDDIERVLAIGRWNLSYHRVGGPYVVRHSRSVGNTCTYLHRFIMDAPSGLQVDHIDRDTLNNCKRNLRCVTRAQNLQNTTARPGSRSGVKNVGWDSRVQLWVVGIRVNRKSIFGGRFPDLESAAKKAREMQLQYHTHCPAQSDFPLSLKNGGA